MTTSGTPRIPRLVAEQVEIVAEIIDSFGHLFLAKPTASYTPSGAKPPRFGSSAMEALFSSQSSAPVSQFLSFVEKPIERIRQNSTDGVLMRHLDAALEALKDYAEVHETPKKAVEGQLPQGIELVFAIKQLRDALSSFKSADQWAAGDNQQPIPLSTSEMAIISHALDATQEAARLPRWSEATIKQVNGVQALLQALVPVVRPVSNQLMDAWNSVIAKLRAALKAFEIKRDKEEEDQEKSEDGQQPPKTDTDDSRK